MQLNSTISTDSYYITDHVSMNQKTYFAHFCYLEVTYTEKKILTNWGKGSCLPFHSAISGTALYCKVLTLMLHNFIVQSNDEVIKYGEKSI